MDDDDSRRLQMIHVTKLIIILAMVTTVAFNDMGKNHCSRFRPPYIIAADSLFTSSPRIPRFYFSC